MKHLLFAVIFALALFTEVEIKSPPASPQEIILVNGSR